MSIPRFSVEFTKDGHIYDQTQVDALIGACDGATDLAVLAHGWNNDMADARGLYDEFIGNFILVRDEVLPGDPRKFVFCEVFWPSKRFTDQDLIPGGGAAGASEPKDAALGALLDELAHDPERLPEDASALAVSRANPPLVRRELVDQAKQLVDSLDTAAGRERFVEKLRTLVDPTHAEDEDGSTAFFTTDSETIFDNLGEDVKAPVPVGHGGAAGVGSGGAAGFLSDLWRGAVAAARRLANFTTYYQMKSRAGTVGMSGLAPLLTAVRARHPGIKLHLAGHSFGGRLVTAAALGMAPDTPQLTLTLLQAAFSHNGLSDDYEDGRKGYFRAIIDERRASGPIVITHTKNDTAVGIAYPLASRVANQKASALGDENDPYGGMGRNGAMRTTEVDPAIRELGEYDTSYPFKVRKIYNLRADRFITNHGDVRRPEVAAAFLAATRAV